MTEVTTEDRELLRKVRQQAIELGEGVAMACRRGYVVTFTINNVTGNLDVFTIARLTNVDISDG